MCLSPAYVCFATPLRYQALRRRHAQGKKHQNKKQATTNSTSGEANSFANMTARDVELALVDSEKALQKVNDEVQRLAADRRRKRKEIAAGKKSIKAMADTLRQLVPLAAKLGVSVLCWRVMFKSASTYIQVLPCCRRRPS